MSYIIAATIYLEDGANDPRGVEVLLIEPRLRVLTKSEADATVTLDMRSGFGARKEDTRWLCNKLIDAGILSFDVGHSF